MEVVNALGRRKAAIARIYVNDGKGQITINNREMKEYFPLRATGPTLKPARGQGTHSIKRSV